MEGRDEGGENEGAVVRLEWLERSTGEQAEGNTQRERRNERVSGPNKCSEREEERRNGERADKEMLGVKGKKE